MEWKTHFLTGAIVGAAYTNDWKGALICGSLALVSDLDEPNSKLGRILFPISMFISTIFPHRTFTHSIPFVILSGLVAYILTFDFTISNLVMLGIVSHIVGDILTGRVQLFYPFKVWVGFRIPPFTYILIDRIARYSLVAVIIFYTYQYARENLGLLNIL